jgi:hypothetical protein
MWGPEDCMGPESLNVDYFLQAPLKETMLVRPLVCWLVRWLVRWSFRLSPYHFECIFLSRL